MKKMNITKDLLMELPKPEPDVVPPNPNDRIISELVERVQALQEQVTFLATFESTLLAAFQKEIVLLRECASATQNDTQKKTFAALASSMERVEHRWCNKDEFYLDRKKMSIERA
jgi:hypothetical protein